MLHKLINKLFPMNNKIRNATLDEYKKIRNLSVSIFLIILQIVYIFRSRFDSFIFKYIFESRDVTEFITGIFISASSFTIIYLIVLSIWQKIWINQHSDSCYLSGIWYHVFDRVIDDDKDYVRAGWLTISQNFYDISVEANNYNVFFENGAIKYDSKSYSHWSFSLSEIQDDGKINACFIKNKEYSSLISNSGIMTLFVANKDHKDHVNEMSGIFSDSGASTVKGNIRFFKYIKRKNLDFEFTECAPDAWKKYIYNQLKLDNQREEIQ